MWLNLCQVIYTRIPIKLKRKFYKIAIRLAMLYGTECWAVKKQHIHKMSVVEMRMLRWISGTQKDRIRKIRLKIKGSPYWWKDEGTKNHLRWFDHVKRRVSNELVRNSELIQVEGTKRGRGRQKITLVEVIKKDMSIREIIESHDFR